MIGEVIVGEIAGTAKTDNRGAGTAFFYLNQVPESGLDSKKVDGIVVQPNNMVRSNDGWVWPILEEGIVRILVDAGEEPVAGNHAYIDVKSGKVYAEAYKGAIRTSNLVFASSGYNCLLGITQNVVDVPLPNFYMPLTKDIFSYKPREEQEVMNAGLHSNG